MRIVIENIVRDARKMRGYTQEQMAEKLGIRRSTYAYKEKNETFDIDELKILSEVLDVAIPELFKEENPSTENKISSAYGVLASPPPVRLKFDDPLHGYITHNERLLLKRYRDLKNAESKEKLKDYLEELIKNEEENI